MNVRLSETAAGEALAAAPVARRWFLQPCGVGLGSAARTALLADDRATMQLEKGVTPSWPAVVGLELRNLFFHESKGK